MEINIELLRKDMLEECYGSFFGGGDGIAMIDSFDIEKASPEELVRMAIEQGIDLRKYSKRTY